MLEAREDSAKQAGRAFLTWPTRRWRLLALFQGPPLCRSFPPSWSEETQEDQEGTVPVVLVCLFRKAKASSGHPLPPPNFHYHLTGQNCVRGPLLKGGWEVEDLAIEQCPR